MHVCIFCVCVRTHVCISECVSQWVVVGYQLWFRWVGLWLPRFMYFFMLHQRSWLSPLPPAPLPPPTTHHFFSFRCAHVWICVFVFVLFTYCVGFLLFFYFYFYWGVLAFMHGCTCVVSSFLLSPKSAIPVFTFSPFGPFYWVLLLAASD